ncbi:uncharacterized protein LOC128221160 [Mya arenaria]|uniref:uncharacterized protein LOC128221160 n=1 Tax=Mya arenaria TaxID=6604 RepID=UPI0022E2183B|nr:uncharacterized protein LOC128221160 [Mya arenaria]
MGEECIFVAVGAVLGVLTLIIVYVIYYWCKNKKRRALVQFFDTTSFKHISKTFRSRYQNATFEIKYSKEEIVSDIPLVVFCLSTSRVEDECRSALEGILYTPSTTLLVVLHRLKDSDTSAVISFFKFDGITETVHLGFAEKGPKFSKSTDLRIKDFLRNCSLESDSN